MWHYLDWQGGFPGGASGEESTFQCRRCKRLGFNSWLGKIPWGRAWLSTPVFLPGELHRWRNSPWGHKQSDVAEHTHARAHTHTAQISTPSQVPKAAPDPPENLRVAQWAAAPNLCTNLSSRMLEPVVPSVLGCFHKNGDLFIWKKQRPRINVSSGKCQAGGRAWIMEQQGTPRSL